MKGVRTVPDSKTALAIVLCVLVVFTYEHLVLSKYRRQSYEASLLRRQQEAPAGAGSSVVPQAQPGNAPQISAPNPNSPAVATTASSSAAPPIVQNGLSITAPSLADVEQGGVIEFASPIYIAKVSKLGGRLLFLSLNRYGKSPQSDEPLNIVEAAPSSVYPLAVYSGQVSDAFTQYEIETTSGLQQQPTGAFLIPEEAQGTLVLKGVLPDGNGIRKSITFDPHTYLFTIKVTTDRPALGDVPLVLEWSHLVAEEHKLKSLDPEQFALLDSATKLRHVPIADATTTGSVGENRWIAITSKYFLAALVGETPKATYRIGEVNNAYTMQVTGTSTGIDASVYAGPKDIDDLKKVGHDLSRSVDLGFFAFLSAPLLSMLRFFYLILGNFGLAIILLTLSIKLLFFPLARASFKSMAAMQDIQPEVQALRDRIKDPTAMNQELMALYKKKGVNPLGGCLPVVIQIPVFLGLYNALLQSIDLRHQPFALWINDLSSPERLMLFGIPIPLMILLMGVSMVVQQWTQPSPTMDPVQRRVMMMMPLMFTVMFIVVPMPAGLVLYWLVNNLISIVQQMYLRGHRRANPLVATVVASLGIFCVGYVLTLL